ncbi:16S rRNA (cytidine(1402)-2'-O)-methyltransferase [Candidatus Parcubacteria bacterium]|nr:MAG: 16S rRNA (cytidine(1402)-2'-O)-methyltransferase [Candidatus Parcubacteria bacterium]
MEEEKKKGKLSIVATPIGNLGDMTFRGLWNLKEAHVIYAEDTRVISKLLSHYGLRTSVQRLDAATEGKKMKEVAERLRNLEHVCLVTDAGTPGISDPGARLVAYVRKEVPEAIIETLPGPSALTAALSIAGLEGGEFTFLGFLPQKKGRQTAVKKIAQSEYPVVLYESPHRILKLLAELEAVGIKDVRIGRELTKMHEEFLVGTPESLAADLKKRKAERGEFVVIVVSH